MGERIEGEAPAAVPAIAAAPSEQELALAKIEEAKQKAPNKTGLVIASNEYLRELWHNFLLNEMKVGTVLTVSSEEEAALYKGLPDVVINTLDTSEENIRRLQETLGLQDIRDIIPVSNIDLTKDEDRNRIMLAVAESI